MEPWSSVLQRVVMERWDQMGSEEQRVVVALLTADRPTHVVRAMDYVQRLAEEVERDLRR